MQNQPNTDESFLLNAADKSRTYLLHKIHESNMFS